MSTDAFGYALFTFQTGHRPISAFSEIFEDLCNSIIPRLEELERDAGSTARRGLEVALSDTAILMAYSLAEGFFFEEYKFYFGREPDQALELTVEALLAKLDIADAEIGRCLAILPALRGARNAVAHRNGLLRDNEKQKLRELFGTAICTSHGYPLATAPAMIEIIQKVRSLVSRYSELALHSAQLAIQPET